MLGISNKLSICSFHWMHFYFETVLHAITLLYMIFQSITSCSIPMGSMFCGSSINVSKGFHFSHDYKMHSWIKCENLFEKFTYKLKSNFLASNMVLLGVDFDDRNLVRYAVFLGSDSNFKFPITQANWVAGNESGNLQRLESWKPLWTGIHSGPPYEPSA